MVKKERIIKHYFLSLPAQMFLNLGMIRTQNLTNIFIFIQIDLNQ